LRTERSPPMLNLRLVVISVCSLMCVTLSHAQRGGTDWTSAGYDAQRSSWVRSDAKISMSSMEKPGGFKFLWKLKFNSDPKQVNALTPPVLLDFYIGYRGFRALGFVGGRSDSVFGVDTDLGRLEWQKRISTAPPAQSTGNCPGGMTAGLTRPTATTIAGGSVGGRGRGGPAKSGVGEPGQGAVTLAQAEARRAALPPPPPGASPAPNPFRRAPSFVYAISSDGMLHAMYVSNGEEPGPPIPFLPANANAHGLIVVGQTAYAATTQGCGGVPNGVWALDLTSKQVNSWQSSGGISGSAGPAFAPDGTLYVATEGGELVALDPASLKVKNTYNSGAAFTSSPVLFQHKGALVAAAATIDGSLHLLDASSLTVLSKTPANSGAADFAPGALTSWQDLDDTRWVLAPSAGAVMAWKVAGQNGALVLQPGWTSREMVAPLTPMVMNGVVFAISSGKRAQRSQPAVLYALDARTGKEVWNSGKTITSFVDGGGLSGGSGQLYLGTYDGTLYAFGFPIEH
ncbi:MAG: PQQ-binding-like beta-propeller repeat protein, partial [Bryobacteraceae bacterium]